MATHLKIYKDRHKQYRWTLYAANGRKLANGGEAYRRRIDCTKIVMKLFPWWRPDETTQG